MIPWWQTLVSVLAGGGLTLVGTVWVSRTSNRAAGRAEWFRRVEWAQQMTTSSDEFTKAAGYQVLDYLSSSKLATADDQGLLERLAQDPDLAALAGVDPETVDATDYVVDTEMSTDEEDPEP